MKIVFVSNFINHYQVPLSDELYKMAEGNYFFVETQELPDSFKKGGFSDYDLPYIVRAWNSEKEKQYALQLCYDADVLVAGGGKFIIPYEKQRLMDGKLTFEYAERSLKKGIINLFSPANIKMQAYYHLFFYNKPFYKLCASAFTSNDMYLQHSFKGRCLKFGYFPQIPDQNIDDIFNERKKNKHIKIIWCARFIKWKHPEVAVLLAEKLRNSGFDFEINMIGGGVLFNMIKDLIRKKRLTDCVNLLGNYPNSEVLNKMREHDVFLFTSDRNEGWGVVLNEAMGQACCPVASRMIGSVPYLLKHNNNGLIYDTGDLQSLFENIVFLIQHPEKMLEMSRKAYKTVKEEWCHEVAAKRLYSIFESYLSKGNVEYEDGPLSPALPVKF